MTDLTTECPECYGATVGCPSCKGTGTVTWKIGEDPECDADATHWGLCEAHAREDDPTALTDPEAAPTLEDPE